MFIEYFFFVFVFGRLLTFPVFLLNFYFSERSRFDICLRDLEKWTSNLLPSRQFGHLVLTTSGGIMDHEEARRKHLGGKILGFFF